MREVGHPLTSPGLDSDLSQGWDELKDEPDGEQDQRRYLHQRDEEDDEDQGEDPRPGEEQRVRAQDTGDRPARAYRRGGRRGVDQRLRVHGDQAGEDVEEGEPKAPESVLDVVAEDPEEEHVPGDVQET